MEPPKSFQTQTSITFSFIHSHFLEISPQMLALVGCAQTNGWYPTLDFSHTSLFLQHRNWHRWDVIQELVAGKRRHESGFKSCALRLPSFFLGILARTRYHRLVSLKTRSRALSSIWHSTHLPLPAVYLPCFRFYGLADYAAVACAHVTPKAFPHDEHIPHVQRRQPDATSVPSREAISKTTTAPRRRTTLTTTTSAGIKTLATQRLAR